MIARLEQWIRWPLWSWRNLVVTVVAVLVLFTAVGRLTNDRASASGGPSALPAAVATTPATGPTSSVPATIAGSPATAPSPGAAASTTLRPTAPATAGQPTTSGTPTQVAVEFTRAWTRTTLDQATWLSGLKALVTPGYLSALSTVDPSRVPASRVVDSGRQLSTSGQQALVQVGTDGGAMTVTLVLHAPTWLVADIEPANLPPGAPTPTLTPTPAAKG